MLHEKLVKSLYSEPSQKNAIESYKKLTLKQRSWTCSNPILLNFNMHLLAVKIWYRQGVCIDNSYKQELKWKRLEKKWKQNKKIPWKKLKTTKKKLTLLWSLLLIVVDWSPSPKISRTTNPMTLKLCKIIQEVKWWRHAKNDVIRLSVPENVRS